MNLDSYSSIQSNLFVRIEIDYYKATSASTPTSTVLRFSDLKSPYMLEGENYTGVGSLMNITSAASELRTSSGELSITLSGIPNSSIYEIVNSRIKGSPVLIYRAVFDPVTGAELAIAGNPATKYRGFVNNYSLQEEFDIDTRTASNSIVLICNSSVDVLEKKVSGRRTNPVSQQRFYPTDSSMDRVPTLENATFDFGVPK
jgi:hypothetical protein